MPEISVMSGIPEIFGIPEIYEIPVYSSFAKVLPEIPGYP